MIMENGICLFCGKTSERVVHEHDTPEGRVRAVICPDDALVYLHPRKTREEYAAYYRGQYHGGVLHGGNDVDEAVARIKKKGSAARFRDIVPFIVAELPKGASVLDVGAGFGNLLSEVVRASGARATGIEPSPLAVDVAQKLYGLTLRKQDFETFFAESALSSERYDRIILHHVLEHLMEPRAALVALRGLLTPTGALYLAVPNVMDIREALDDFFRIPHPWNFSPATLTRLLHETGWMIIAFRRQPPPKVGMELLAVPCEQGVAECDASLLVEGADMESVVAAIGCVGRSFSMLRTVWRPLQRLLPRGVRGCLGRALRRPEDRRRKD